MIIFIIGNMSSGKSTVSKELKKRLNKFKILSLDDYRRKLNKNCTISGDEKAQLKLVNDISSQDNIIVDSTGTGKWYKYYLNAASNKKIKVIKLKANVNLCTKRHKERLKNGYKLPPFPYNLDFYDGLDYMDSKLRSVKSDFQVDSKKELNIVVDNIYDYLKKEGV